jgi:hypothetical protein
MGFIVSLLIIAVGAILTWGVADTSNTVNLDVVGVVLMIVGGIGFLITLFLWESWWGPGYFRRSSYRSGYGRRQAGPYRRDGYVVEEEEEEPVGPPPP